MEDVTGLDEVLKKLKKLPERIQKNVVVGAVRAGTKPIVKEAKALVPTNTGTLKKSIGAVKRKSKNKNIIHFSVSPRKIPHEEYLAHEEYIANFLEFGTYAHLDHPMKRTRTGKLGVRRRKIVAKGLGIRPHPFMRPAFEKKGEESIEYVREYMKKRVDKEIAKL